MLVHNIYSTHVLARRIILLEYIFRFYTVIQ